MNCIDFNFLGFATSPLGELVTESKIVGEHTEYGVIDRLKNKIEQVGFSDSVKESCC